MYVYIYIYTYICVYTYTFIGREDPRAKHPRAKANSLRDCESDFKHML